MFRPSGLNSQFHGTRGVIHIEVTPRPVADDNMTLLRAARAGVGIVLLPRYMARDALTRGSLVSLLDDKLPPETWFKIYVPRRKRHTARIEALVGFVSTRMKEDRWIDEIRLPG
jgi:DNA-binding transcriptional LysR family regulator